MLVIQMMVISRKKGRQQLLRLQPLPALRWSRPKRRDPATRSRSVLSHVLGCVEAEAIRLLQAGSSNCMRCSLQVSLHDLGTGQQLLYCLSRGS
jgi:hypothetical protein